MALSENATLADAKDLFDKNPVCLDILVTQDGTKNGIVVGWITNVMVLQERFDRHCEPAAPLTDRFHKMLWVIWFIAGEKTLHWLTSIS
jgi:hypothetical protein